MGIRYYAYAFDGDMTEQALADPQSILSEDPLADAWGLEPGARFGTTTFEQTVPARDMLYLDKAWPYLQALTAPEKEAGASRPAYRMFEGQVAMNGQGWDSWVRALAPQELADIVRDLRNIADDEAERRFRDSACFGQDPDREAAYALGHLRRARDFVSGLAAEGRGLVYLIG